MVINGIDAKKLAEYLHARFCTTFPDDCRWRNEIVTTPDEKEWWKKEEHKAWLEEARCVINVVGTISVPTEKGE